MVDEDRRVAGKNPQGQSPRGSRASRSPSPSRLKPNTTRKIATPGHTDIHGACVRKFLAVLSMLPQRGSGGCWPSPRKDRLAWAMIAVAVVSVACTCSGGEDRQIAGEGRRVCVRVDPGGRRTIKNKSSWLPGYLYRL